MGKLNMLLMIWISIFFLQIKTGKCQQVNCNLDDVQRTKGVCMPIKQCPHALAQLYAAGQSNVKKCPQVSKTSVCCPTEPTMSQKKCQQYLEILKSPLTFSQQSFKEPMCAYQGAKEFIVGGREAHEFEFGYAVSDENYENSILHDFLGKHSPELISGGKNALESQFPHAVGLGYGNNPNSLEYLCGATLISDTYLLTAGHCLTSKKGRPSYAVVGDLTLTDQTSIYRKKIRIVDWILHPNYSTPLIYNDIAILKLGERLELSRYVLPACLGDAAMTPKDTEQPPVGVFAIGWGRLGYGESQATRLQAVDLKIKGIKSCDGDFADDSSKNFRFPQGLQRSQFCAIGDLNQDVHKDTCNGDSGGGLVVYDKKVNCLYHVIGITSIGSRLCGYGDPGVYTKVLTYIDWIEKTIWTSG